MNAWSSSQRLMLVQTWEKIFQEWVRLDSMCQTSKDQEVERSKLQSMLAGKLVNLLPPGHGLKELLLELQELQDLR